jgi:hypothetical protein
MILRAYNASVTDPAARAADDSMTLGQMRERLEELLKHNYGQRAELVACIKVCASLRIQNSVPENNASNSRVSNFCRKS